MRISLSAFAPENLVSRDGFGSPVPRQPAHLHTQAESSICSLFCVLGGTHESCTSILGSQLSSDCTQVCDSSQQGVTNNNGLIHGAKLLLPTRVQLPALGTWAAESPSDIHYSRIEHSVSRRNMGCWLRCHIFLTSLAVNILPLKAV